MLNSKKSIMSASIIALTTMLATPAFAFDISEAEDNQKPYANEFKDLDKSGKGEINWTTVKKETDIKHKNFVAHDKDKNGKLSYNEYAELKTEQSKKTVGGAASDSWITTKVKSELLAEKNLKSLKISVETHAGQVLLSGFVNSEDQKEKAEAVAKNVKGVTSVENSLIVKKETDD